MSNAQTTKRSGAWSIFMGIGLFLYIVNASVLIYYQFEYYTNPGLITSMLSILPSAYTSQITSFIQDGFVGLFGVISILIVLAIIYMATGVILSNRSSKALRIALIASVIIQLFIGNAGMILGLILLIVSIFLMR